MKRCLLILAFLCAPPVGATTYYLATAAGGGSDANNGTAVGTPWLSPNHALNCGDVIQAAASTAYSAANFASGKWGAVTCSSGKNVAWLTCVTFDACKISITSGNGMTLSASYWGVQGWEVNGTSASNYCILATPPSISNIHHIIVANTITTGCGLAGIEAGNNATAGVDYFNVLGSIAYGTSGSSTFCGSGLDMYSPVASDTLPGTHVYFAGNFSWANVNPATCNGTPSTDGEGIIFDDIDGDQVAGLGPYKQQMVADNNILLGNGGRGLEIFLNLSGGYWSLVHSNEFAGFGCSTSTTFCNGTITGTTAGDILVVKANLFPNSHITSVTSGGGESWSLCPASACNGVNAGAQSTDQAYTLAAGTGTTTLTVNISAINGFGWQYDVEEYAWSGTGAVAYDAGGNTNSASCTTCLMPSLTLSGTNDLISVSAGSSGSMTAIGGCFTNPAFQPSGGIYFAGCINTNNGAVPSITETSGTFAGSALAIKGSANNAPIYARYNTIWGNNTDLNQTNACSCQIGELLLNNNNTTRAFGNLAATNTATGVNGDAIYAAWQTNYTQVGNAIYTNDFWSATGTYTNKFDPQGLFTFGPNNVNTNPSFVNAVLPGAPSCGSSTSVPNCMAAVIANFTPTTTAAKAYGYQIPSANSIYDPLYPAWLCSVTNLPSGLVTPGCTGPAPPSSLSILLLADYSKPVEIASGKR